MLESHPCGVCGNMVSLTRTKRGVKNSPKSQKEIDATKYCSRKCYHQSNYGKRYNVIRPTIDKKPKVRTVTAEPDFINRWCARARQ